MGDIAEFVPYHDDDWGFPIDDDQRLFEKLSLESFQSGLSWRTILNKREAFREVFWAETARKRYKDQAKASWVPLSSPGTANSEYGE